MPTQRRDNYSKALIFKPTVEEQHLRSLTKDLEQRNNSLKTKEAHLDTLIEKLEERLQDSDEASSKT